MAVRRERCEGFRSIRPRGARPGRRMNAPVAG